MIENNFQQKIRAEMIEQGYNPRTSDHIKVYSQLGKENYNIIRETIFRYLCEEADILDLSSKEGTKNLEQEIDATMKRVSEALVEMEKREIRLKDTKIPRLSDMTVFSKAMAQIFPESIIYSQEAPTVHQRTIEETI